LTPAVIGHHSLDLPIGLSPQTARWKRGIIPHCMNDPQPEGHMASYIQRRKFLATLGGAAVAWPIGARAQQPPMPVVGVLHGGWGLHHGSPAVTAWLRAAIRQGLKETGFVEDHNVRIEYRWAEDHYDRLPQLAADLARRQVAVIIANTPTMLAAKAASTTIPIVFVSADDPVRLGLVASLNRPGGNITGVTLLLTVLGAK